MQEIKLVLDQQVLDEYADYYFKKHPRSWKKPIEKPWHPSINEWIRMPRPQMNGLKQKWKEFVVWWMNKLGYQEMMLDSFEMIEIIYFNTRKHADIQNYISKFIDDGLVEAGVIVDDDYKHLRKLTMQIDYDKEWPRTEIIVRTIDDEKEQKL